MPGVGVADWLADSQSKQGLIAGVGQRVDGLGEHAGWSSVDPSQELEKEIQPIAADKENQWMKQLQGNVTIYLGKII